MVDFFKNSIGFIVKLICGLIAVIILLVVILIATTSYYNDNYVPADTVSTVESAPTTQPSDYVDKWVETSTLNNSKVAEPVSMATDDIGQRLYNRIDKVTNYDYKYKERIANLIVEISSAYNVNPVMVCALIEKESKYNQDLITDSGIGIMQIPESTAKSLGKELKITYDLSNVEDNLVIGAFFVARLLNTFKNQDKAIAFYGGGYTESEHYESSTYLKQVKEIMSKI